MGLGGFCEENRGALGRPQRQTDSTRHFATWSAAEERERVQVSRYILYEQTHREDSAGEKARLQETGSKAGASTQETKGHKLAEAKKLQPKKP